MTTVLSTYRTQCRRLLHDANANIWSDSELNDYINDARDRTCRDTECLRTLYSGYVQTGQESFQYGSLTGLSITSGGGNYTLPPLVGISGGGGTGATATTTITNGVVTSVTITNAGSGYTSNPTVTVTNAPGDVTGSGCSLSPGILGAMVLDVWNVTIINGNTRSQLNYYPFTQFNVVLRPWKNWQQQPYAWTDYGPTMAVLGPIPDQTYPVEWDTSIVCNALVDDTSTEQIPWMFQNPVKYYACYLAKMKQQAIGEADYFKERYAAEAVLVSNQVFARRIPDPYSGGGF